MRSQDIYNYWNQKAEKLGTDPSATMKDVILRSIEIESIGDRLKADDVLLDIGAGNAFASLEWARRCKMVVALDFSPKMIEAAQEAIAASRRDNIRAEHGDILNLSQYAGKFTAVSSVRCLINMASEEDQYLAINQLAKELRPNGRLFLIGGLAETFDALNKTRQQAQLLPISLNWHNRLFSRETLENWLAELFTIEESVDFGEYYFLSRIVHPLLVAPGEPDFTGQLNIVAKRIWQSGIARGRFDFMSALKLYVCKRR